MHGGWLKGRALSPTSAARDQCKCLQCHCRRQRDDDCDDDDGGDDEVGVCRPFKAHYVHLLPGQKTSEARVAYKLASSSVLFWQQEPLTTVH